MTFENRYTETFARHQLRSERPGRYLIQRPNGDGSWDWCMAAEILVSMNHTTLIVCGDIDLCVFGNYHARQDLTGAERERSLLRWMGRSRDINYIAEKAGIGMSSDKLVWDYDVEKAKEAIRAFQAELKPGEHGPTKTRFVEGLDRLLENTPESRDLLQEAIWDLDTDLAGYFFDHDHVACVITPRVFAAQAAVARLCDLLDARDATEVRA